MVGAGAEGGDELGAALGEDFETGAVDLVVDKDESGAVAGAEGGGGGSELGFEEFEMVTARGVFGPESGFGIGARAERQRFHSCEIKMKIKMKEWGICKREEVFVYVYV